MFTDQNERIESETDKSAKANSVPVTDMNHTSDFDLFKNTGQMFSPLCNNNINFSTDTVHSKDAELSDITIAATIEHQNQNGSVFGSPSVQRTSQGKKKNKSNVIVYESYSIYLFFCVLRQKYAYGG